jgi:hypothetical protein
MSLLYNERVFAIAAEMFGILSILAPFAATKLNLGQTLKLNPQH